MLTCCLPRGVQAFGTILNLVPLAESVVKLTAVCMECFREAAYTKRLGSEKEVASPACPCLLGGGGVGGALCRRSPHPCSVQALSVPGPG